MLDAGMLRALLMVKAGAICKATSDGMQKSKKVLGGAHLDCWAKSLLENVRVSVSWVCLLRVL